LCIPVLIFGTGAVEAVTSGLSIASHFSLLGALLIMALVFTPWVTAQALRISME
jgi:heme exporter protein B